MRGIGNARLFTGVGNVIQSLASGIVPVTLKGASGQAADMLKVVNSAGTELFSILASGIPLLTAGGIKFPATQVPSGDVNVLDDYEEGTWTPGITFATPGDLSVTYSAQTGRYTKIGRFVFIECYVQTSAFTHTSASGVLAVTGLPFTVPNVFQGVAACAFRGWTDTLGWIGARPARDSTTVDFIISESATALVQVTAAIMPTGGTVDIRFQLGYVV